MAGVNEAIVEVDGAGLELFKCSSCAMKHVADQFEVDRHDRRRKCCIPCKARRDARRCPHGRQRAACKDCGGGSICEHGRRRNRCKDCGGSSICEHDRLRATCKACGGTSICIHDRRRQYCKECDGASFCEHDRRRHICRDCDPDGHLRLVVTTRIFKALNYSPTKGPLEYLGCPISVLRVHIERQFVEGMTWETYGQWQMDHVIPIMYEDVRGVPPTLEEISKRLHWSNIQPMWRADNAAKGNRWVGGAQPAPAPPPAPADIERLLSDADIDELLSGLGL